MSSKYTSHHSNYFKYAADCLKPASQNINNNIIQKDTINIAVYYTAQ